MQSEVRAGIKEKTLIKNKYNKSLSSGKMPEKTLYNHKNFKNVKEPLRNPINPKFCK
jgi:hypothetical protein